MAFDPTQIPDETTYEGHLSSEPMSQLLGAVMRGKCTGRVCIQDDQGRNFLFFMQGRPVGVVLSQVLSPLGQLLLELGKVDSAQFVKAQKLIGDGERLPGQVFIEIGAITEADLKETLAIQARRKSQKFVTFRNLAFEFNRGLSFLTGFKSVPMEGPPLVYHALAAELDAASRQTYLDGFATKRLRALNTSLGAALESFGFGRAEERFLQRLAEWQTVKSLDEFGTLPREDMAVLLKFLDTSGLLEVGDPAPAQTASSVAQPTPSRPIPRPAPAPQSAARPPSKPPPAVSAVASTALRLSKKPEAYGPSPNAATQSTRGRRDMDQRRDEVKPLPSVLIDYDALGLKR